MKKPRKLNAKQRELQASWNDIVDRWASVPKFARTSAPRVALGRPTKATNEPDRPARPYPSLVTPGGSTAPVKTQQYTGTLIMGIATMHKSNLVPVLNGDDAVAVARMRRG